MMLEVSIRYVEPEQSYPLFPHNPKQKGGEKPFP